MTGRRKRNADAPVKLAADITAVGESYLRHGQYSDAEPLLRTAFDELVAVRPAPAEVISKTVDRLIALYAAWEKPDEAARWRAKRAEYPAERLPPPRPAKGP